MVADDPMEKIELKAFHCQIENNHEALKNEQERYNEIPVVRKLDNAIVQKNYLQIKQDLQDLSKDNSCEIAGIISPGDIWQLLLSVFFFWHLLK
jgi:hypothetical protein